MLGIHFKSLHSLRQKYLVEENLASTSEAGKHHPQREMTGLYAKYRAGRNELEKDLGHLAWERPSLTKSTALQKAEE